MDYMYEELHVPYPLTVEVKPWSVPLQFTLFIVRVALLSTCKHQGTVCTSRHEHVIHVPRPCLQVVVCQNVMSPLGLASNVACSKIRSALTRAI